MDLLDSEKILECPICCDILQSVRETLCCHYLFCEECLLSWSDSNSTCPGCRTYLDLSLVKQNIPIQRFIDALPVDCPYRLNGCKEAPVRAALEEHKHICPFRPECIEAEKAKRLEELNNRRQNILMMEDNLKVDMTRLFGDDKMNRFLEVANEMCNLAMDLFASSNYEEATVLATKAMNYKKEIFGNEATEIVDVLILLGKILFKSAKYDDALSFLEVGKNITLSSNNFKLLFDISLLIGDIYIKLAKYNEARNPYNDALDISITNFGPTSRERGIVYNAIGILEKKCSDYDKALSSYLGALNVIDENDPLWTEIATNLADVYRKKGLYSESRDLYMRALKKLESKHGDMHSEIAEVCNALGMLEKKRRKLC